MGWNRMTRIAVGAAIVAAVYGVVPASATDLIGRNGEFTVKDSKGAVETVDSKQLEMQKELMLSAPRALITDASDGSAPASDKKDGKPAAKKTAAAAPKPAAPRPETPEEKATRAADVETLRAMRKEGGAYFYTEDNQPVPFDEIDRRIESGEVEGLKAVGLHLQEWKPETKKKASSTTGGSAASAPAASTASATSDSATSTKATKKY